MSNLNPDICKTELITVPGLCRPLLPDADHPRAGVSHRPHQLRHRDHLRRKASLEQDARHVRHVSGGIWTRTRLHHTGE